MNCTITAEGDAVCTKLCDFFIGIGFVDINGIRFTYFHMLIKVFIEIVYIGDHRASVDLAITKNNTLVELIAADKAEGLLSTVKIKGMLYRMLDPFIIKRTNFRKEPDSCALFERRWVECILNAVIFDL